MQLRFEGVDATELHYGTDAQPMGAQARDVLLGWLGFTNVTYEATSLTKVASAKPATISAATLSLASDPFGRPVSFVGAMDVYTV